MDSFIFKGKSSDDFNIIVNSLPPITKPAMRVEETEIDGVDGVLYEDLGYESYKKTIKITLKENNIDELIHWLKGEGELTLSNEPDKYYKAKIIEQIDFERLMKYEPVEVVFRVQPFKYEYQEEEQTTATGSVEGTKVKITDAKATEIKIEGRSTQEPTTGKNLVDLENPTGLYNCTYDKTTKTYTSNTLTGDWAGMNIWDTNHPITVNAGESLYYSADIRLVSGSTSNNKINALRFGDNNITGTTTTIINNPTLTSTFQRIVFKSTFPNSATTSTHLIQVGTSVNNVVLEVKNFMISKSSNTDFEPYTGGIPSPNPNYPSEIESVGYENLFDKDNANIIVSKYLNSSGVETNDSSFSISDYIEVQPSTIYSLTPWRNASACLCYYDSSKTFLSSVPLYSINTSFTTPSNCQYVRFSISKENIDITMITKGPIAHSYIPYGKYGIKVKTTGKNLLNKENTTKSTSSVNYEILDTGIRVYNTSTGTHRNVYVDTEILPSGTYTLNKNISVTSGVGYILIQTVDDDGNTTAISYSSSSGGTTFTLDTDSKIRIVLYSTRGTSEVGDVSYTDLQLELGDTVTKYEPYKSNTTTMVLDEPLRNLPNGVKDIAYIKNNKLYVDRYVGSIVLDGSEVWSYESNNQRFFTSSVPNVNTNATRTIIISSHFKFSTAYHEDGIGFVYSKILYLYNYNFTTVNEFKTWLSENNVEVIYELETPVTEEYGEFNILQLVDGENIISNSEDANMVIDYVDNKMVINNTGNYIAKPIFEVEGSGTIAFILNGNSVFTYNFDADGRVVIDSEKEDAYLDAVLKNRNMNGEFPKLEVGENIITWNGLVKNIKAVKKSRWL